MDQRSGVNDSRALHDQSIVPRHGKLDTAPASQVSGSYRHANSWRFHPTTAMRRRRLEKAPNGDRSHQQQPGDQAGKRGAGGVPAGAVACDADQRLTTIIQQHRNAHGAGFPPVGPGTHQQARRAGHRPTVIAGVGHHRRHPAASRARQKKVPPRRWQAFMPPAKRHRRRPGRSRGATMDQALFRAGNDSGGWH